MIHISRKRLLVGTGVALILASSTILAVNCSPAGSGSTVVAFPRTLPETEVIDALHNSGHETVIAATTLRIPLSDFSRLVDVPVSNALIRAPRGDPRRTPLLDHLESRFHLRAPDGASWNVLYIRETAESAHENLTGSLDALGVPYAIDSTRVARRLGYLWLPVAVWLVWLVMRKPRGFALVRIMQALPWLPLLSGATTESAFLAVSLELAAVMAGPYLAGGMLRPLASRLAPFVLSAIAMIALDTGILPRLGVSAGLVLLMLGLAPRIEIFFRKKWLHSPPVFKPITRQGAASGFKPLLVSAIFPTLALLAVAILFPMEHRYEPGKNTGFQIIRGTVEDRHDESALVASHIAFQRALTYGRLGEASWGASSYSDAYRYETIEGRIRRMATFTPPVHDAGQNGVQDSRNLAFVLSEPPLDGIVRR